MPTRFPASLDALPAALALVADACRDGGIDQAVRLRSELALEELFTNTVRHGGGFGITIEIAVATAAGALSLTYRDSAAAFDPFAEVMAAGRSAATRTVGGLGRQLVAELADRASYRRQGAWNCSELSFSPRAG